MITQIIKDALLMKPVKALKDINNETNLARLFFSHQGRKYCKEKKFPPIHLFREEKTIHRLGFFVDAGEIIAANESNIGLIGSTSGLLFFTDNSKVHKITLMHGAKARIQASNHTVLIIANIDGCDLEIHKDDTVLVL